MTHEEQIQDAITKTLAFSKIADRTIAVMNAGILMSSPSTIAQSAAAEAELKRAVEDMQETVTPGVVVQIVKHYETLLAKAEAESVRMTIMRETIRQVMREEREAK